MKTLKKFLLLTLCVGVIAGMTACSNKNDKNDGATNTMNDATQGTTTDKKMDAEGDRPIKDAEEGIQDVGDGVGEGVRDVTDDVKDGVDNIVDDMDGKDDYSNGTDNNMQNP